VLRGLASFYALRADYEKSIQMAQRILRLGERLNDPTMRVEGHLILGYTTAFANDLQGGLNHLDRSISNYERNQQVASNRLITRKGQGARTIGSNPGVVALTVSALFLWMQGFPDRARMRSVEATALARNLNHPFSLGYAQFHCALLHLWLRDFESARQIAGTVIDLAEEHGFEIWSAAGTCLRGIAMVHLGMIDQGLAQFEQGMTDYRELKTPPVFYALLLYFHAGALQLASRPQESFALLNEAIQIASSDREGMLAAEFMSLTGKVLVSLSLDNASEAESWYLQAVTSARKKNAAMLELRAALGLSRLWQAQGKSEQAHQLLSEAYAKLTEGFTTPDIKEATALLSELSQKENL
jgi:tetratricopeptide (TPR) repeat protein